MKNLVLLSLLLLCFGFESCKKANEVEEVPVQAEVPVNTECFEALYEKDSILLEINTLKSGKITGKMIMIFEDMPVKTGEISGEFRGDTLFADYSFSQGANEDRVFKNPIALLKKNSLLILGNGKIETYLGKSYFAKGIPIDFENVKFKFNSIDCSTKE